MVQSAWGMTQGVVMPLSGFLINAIGQKVTKDDDFVTTFMGEQVSELQAAMVSGSIIFSAGCALTYITINKVGPDNRTLKQ